MVENNEKDWLDDLLRNEPPHIAENGFAESVLAALPTRKMNLRVRALVLTGAVLLGGILGLFVLPGGEVLAGALGRLFLPDTWLAPVLHLDSIMFALVVLAGAIWGGVSLAQGER